MFYRNILPNFQEQMHKFYKAQKNLKHSPSNFKGHFFNTRPKKKKKRNKNVICQLTLMLMDTKHLNNILENIIRLGFKI